jgi:hypothetical protein
MVVEAVMATEVAEAEAEAEAEAAEAETVSNDSNQVVMAVSRQQQWQMESDGGDLLEWRASGEVHVRAMCKGNLTDLRRILHLSLAKGNPK